MCLRLDQISCILAWMAVMAKFDAVRQFRIEMMPFVARREKFYYMFSPFKFVGLKIGHFITVRDHSS